MSGQCVIYYQTLRWRWDVSIYAGNGGTIMSWLPGAVMSAVAVTRPPLTCSLSAPSVQDAPSAELLRTLRLDKNPALMTRSKSVFLAMQIFPVPLPSTPNPKRHLCHPHAHRRRASPLMQTRMTCPEIAQQMMTRSSLTNRTLIQTPVRPCLFSLAPG